MAAHTTLNTGQMRLVAVYRHIHSQPGGGGHRLPLHCIGSHSQIEWPARAVGGKLCSRQRKGWPLVSSKRWNWIILIVSKTDREVKPIRLRGWDIPGLVDRGISQVEGISCENRWIHRTVWVGPCETHRRQRSPWNFRSYDIILSCGRRDREREGHKDVSLQCKQVSILFFYGQ